MDEKYKEIQKPLSRNERLLMEIIKNGGGTSGGESGSGSGSSSDDTTVDPDDPNNYITGPDAAAIFDNAEKNANDGE